MPPEHWRRHPFGRVPALTAGVVVVDEISVILRYVDEAVTDPMLQHMMPPPRHEQGASPPDEMPLRSSSTNPAPSVAHLEDEDAAGSEVRGDGGKEGEQVDIAEDLWTPSAYRTIRPLSCRDPGLPPVAVGRSTLARAPAPDPTPLDRQKPLAGLDAVIEQAERARTRYLVHVEELAAARRRGRGAGRAAPSRGDRLVRLRESRAALVSGELAQPGDGEGMGEHGE